MDALTSAEEVEHFDKAKKASAAGKDVAGTYGMSKAKKNSTLLRRMVGPITKTGSILIILSQTRDNLGFGYAAKTRAGGHSLRFYATLEVWASIKETLKKTIFGKPRQIGVKSRWQVKKNRITGKLATVDFDIFPSYGIDDVGSMVDWLVDEKCWVKGDTRIKTTGLGQGGESYTREKLISLIEEKGLQGQVQKLVTKRWREIELKGALDRPPKYAGKVEPE